MRVKFAEQRRGQSRADRPTTGAKPLTQQLQALQHTLWLLSGDVALANDGSALLSGPPFCATCTQTTVAPLVSPVSDIVVILDALHGHAATLAGIV